MEEVENIDSEDLATVIEWLKEADNVVVLPVLASQQSLEFQMFEGRRACGRQTHWPSARRH